MTATAGPVPYFSTRLPDVVTGLRPRLDKALVFQHAVGLHDRVDAYIKAGG